MALEQENINIKEKLIDIIQQFTKASREDLLNQDFSGDELDSLAIVEILFQIEDEFQVVFTDEKAKEIHRFSSLLAVLEELLEAKQGA